MKTDYDFLIFKKLQGEISPSEQERLNIWLNESADHQKRFSTLQQLWKNVHPAKPPIPFNAHEMWQQLLQQLNDQRSLLTLPSKKRLLPSYFYYAAAAIVIVFFSLWFFKTTQQTTITTHSAQKQTVTLPDHSIVKLNANSSLTYRWSGSAKIRKVFLKGEAFFQVTPDAQKPFVVETKNALISVLGTSFNVKHRSGQTAVYVQHGVVTLQNKHTTTKSVRLQAGQYSYCKDQLPPINGITLSAPTPLAWLEGKLIFQATPLPQVAEELKHLYGRAINVDRRLQNLRLNGVFTEHDSLSAILHTIGEALNVKVSEQEHGFVLLP